MKIVVEPRIYQNETLSSWLIRSSILNGSQPSDWANIIFDDNRIWNKDIDRFLPKEKLTKLSKVSSKTIEELTNMTLEPLIQKIFKGEELNPKKSWTFVISTGQRGSYKRNGTYFCPLCIEDDRNFHFRQEFRLAWNTSCYIHNIKLIQKCQKCNKNYTPNKVTYSNSNVYLCTNCGYDLRNSITEACNLEVLNFQTKLNKAIFNDIINENFPLIEVSTEELFKTLRILLSFLRALFKTNKYELFLKQLNLSIPDNFLNALVYSDSFEDMDTKTRDFFILITSRVCDLKLDEIKSIFEELDFSYKLVVEQSTLTSKTIFYLAQSLKINSKQRNNRLSKKEILPKSADEVNKMIEELKLCL